MSSIELINKLNTLEQLISKQNLLLKPILSFKEACEYMGVSASFLYKRTSDRDIAHSCPNGKMLFFKREDLDAWMQRNPQRTKSEVAQGSIRSLVGKGGQKNG